jgi:hypothetical protein
MGEEVDQAVSNRFNTVAGRCQVRALVDEVAACPVW